jgi:hypothetical protein
MLIAPAEPDHIIQRGGLNNMADSNPIIKICTRCNHALALESFYVSRANKDGRTYACKACIAIYYSQNRETLREKSRAWYHNNKARARQSNQRWKDQHRDYLREYERERHKANPELKHARDRRYDQKNRRNRKRRYRIRPAGVRLAAAEAQAKKWQAAGVCSVQQLLAKLQYHGWCCLYCKAL